MAFRLSLLPANPSEVRGWLRRAWGTAAGTGVVTISTVVGELLQIFPEDVLNELPDYKRYIYMAQAFAIIASLPLLGWPRVVALQLTKLGVATALFYLGFSLLGVFLPEFRFMLRLLLVVVAGLFLLPFYQEVAFYREQRSRSDIGLKIVLLVVFLIFWLYPIFATPTT